jgi:cytosine permease
VIAVAIHTYAPAISLNTAYLIVVTYSVVFVLGSIQRWLDMFNGVLLPFYVIGLVTAVATAISRHGLNDHWLKLGAAGGAFSLAGVWYSFTYFMGVWIVFMYTFDYARFGKLQDSAYITPTSTSAGRFTWSHFWSTDQPAFFWVARCQLRVGCRKSPRF